MEEKNALIDARIDQLTIDFIFKLWTILTLIEYLLPNLSISIAYGVLLHLGILFLQNFQQPKKNLEKTLGYIFVFE